MKIQGQFLSKFGFCASLKNNSVYSRKYTFASKAINLFINIQSSKTTTHSTAVSHQIAMKKFWLMDHKNLSLWCLCIGLYMYTHTCKHACVQTLMHVCTVQLVQFDM